MKLKINPLVSVIIPAYNAESYLAITLESVLNQTFSNFEILIIDDGSTDKTTHIALKYSLLDDRIRLIKQDNHGVATSRNVGIKYAKGEYLAFLDADDIWLPHKLETHIEHFHNTPNLGLSFGKVEFITVDGHSTKQYSNSRLQNIHPEDLYYENLVITPSNAVIPKQVFAEIGGFDPEINGMEDAELFLRITCSHWKVEGIDQILIQYRNNSSGFSSHLQRLEKVWEEANTKIHSYAPDLIINHYATAKAYFLRYLARRAIRLKNPTTIAINYINRAIQSHWRILYQEPRRTLSTLVASYLYAIAKNAQLFIQQIEATSWL